MVKDREVREPSSISPGPKGGKLQSSKVVPGSSCTNEVGQQLAHQKICNYRIQQLSQTLENADFPLPCGPEGFFFFLAPPESLFSLKAGILCTVLWGKSCCQNFCHGKNLADSILLHVVTCCLPVRIYHSSSVAWRSWRFRVTWVAGLRACRVFAFPGTAKVCRGCKPYFELC